MFTIHHISNGWYLISSDKYVVAYAETKELIEAIQTKLNKGKSC